ncbi:MAG: glycosyltransferase family 4 protein, partial [Candidatus Pacebacteria bacterium]|nr:glycosyltransferase family 4 protein [Candidatus Paceibacterota bacterium]
RVKDSGKVTLFYSSRMAPGKGFDLLVAAFSEIKNKENFRLILGGTGPEEEQVRKMVRDLKIEKYIEFPGWVQKEKVYEYYKQADIFVQPHWRTDNTSISLSYAMAFGLPSILPGGGGLEWVAKKSALYFKDLDYRDLARKIEELGSKPELRKELSANCYARINEDEMNAEKQMARLCREMERVKKSA